MADSLNNTLQKPAANQTWFVGRHQGSIDWIKEQSVHINHFCSHIDDSNMPKAGDTVIGTLPVHVIARINRIGVRFIHLELDLNQQTRGIELKSIIIEQSNAKLQEYMVWRIDHQGEFHV